MCKEKNSAKAELSHSFARLIVSLQTDYKNSRLKTFDTENVFAVSLIKSTHTLVLANAFTKYTYTHFHTDKNICPEQVKITSHERLLS